MKKGVALLVVYFVLANACFSANPPKQSLLVVQLDPESSENYLQHLVRYHFLDGKYVSKDTILSVPSMRKDVKGAYVRFDIGTNRVYRNRYVVTGIGNIIDVEKKKLLLDQKDQFIKFSGDSLVFYTNDIFKGKYYSVFDLKTEKYTKVESLTYKAIVGGNIEADCSEKPYKIWLYDITDKRELLVEDAGDVEVKGPKQNYVPYFWLSKTSFLYAKTSTQSGKTAIYKVSTDKTQELIGQVEALQYFGNVGFYTDEEGGIVFSSAKAKYKVDLDKKSVTKLSFIPVGNKFYAELDENPVQGRRIKDGDAEIGKYFLSIANVKTTEKMLALSYEMAVGDERYPQGIMLWNRDSKAWEKLDVPDIGSVIGWIQK